MRQTGLPSDAVILATIMEARKSAEETARYLGMEPAERLDFPACLMTDRIQARLPGDVDTDDEADVEEVNIPSENRKGPFFLSYFFSN